MLRAPRSTTLLALLSVSTPAAAQDAPAAGDEGPELSLDALLNIEVVTASKEAESVHDAPAVIAAISADTLQKEGALSVAEALESAAGVDLLTDHVQYNLGVRGINGGLLAGSRIVKVMIANQPTSFRSSTENFLGEELIPIEAVERIEVVRGPASALYGANAFMGVVHVIPKKGKDIGGGLVSPKFGQLEGHSWMGLSLLGGWGNETSDAFVAISGSRKDRSGLAPKDTPDKTKYDGGDESENDKEAPRSAYVAASHTFGIGKLTLDGAYQRLDAYGELQDSSVLTHDNRVQLDNQYVRLAWDKELTKGISARVAVASSAGKPGKDERIDTGETDVHYEREVGYTGSDVVVEADIRPVKAWSLRVGFDSSTETQNLLTYYAYYPDRDHVAVGEPQGKKTFKNQGYWAQGRVQPFAKLSPGLLGRVALTTGVRRDDHNIYGDETNYRVGAVLPFTKDDYVKLLYGTSYKAPAAMQLFLAKPVAVGGAVGNEDLKPEHAKSTDLVIGLRPAPAVDLTTTLYKQEITDQISFVKNRRTSQTQLENVGKIDGQGAEEEIAYAQGRVSGYLNLSYQKNTVHTEDQLLGDRDLPAPAYADKLAKLGVNVKVPEAKLNVHTRVRYVGERTASELNTRYNDPVDVEPYDLEPYTLVDLILSTLDVQAVKGKPTTVTVKAENLTGATYAFPGFRDFDIPGYGRSFTLILAQGF